MVDKSVVISSVASSVRGNQFENVLKKNLIKEVHGT